METFLLCCVYNISLRISHSVVLLAANCLSLPRNVLVSPPILKDSFSQLSVIYFQGLKSIMPFTLECWGLFTGRLRTFNLNVAVLKNLGSSYLTKTLHACSHCLAYLCTCFWCTSLRGIRLQVEQLRLREAKHLPGTMLAALTAGPGHRYRLQSSLHRHHGSLAGNTPSYKSSFFPGHLIIGTQKTF